MYTETKQHVIEKVANYLSLIATAENQIKDHNGMIFRNNEQGFFRLAKHYEERNRIDNRIISRLNNRVNNLLKSII